ncbi:polynucleotidyl transferase, ribonuclease H-like superfamily protein [Tasmannia lanceolata]|uniref:polynucleotidyl transferase, ribonuclease H-like superfamily protein n=1 Tax=Tasmannia lanceolata TaxID=3420 RepID=UPI00406401C8
MKGGDRKEMGGEKPKPSLLNPNWANLQQKLKSRRPKHSEPESFDLKRKIVERPLGISPQLPPPYLLAGKRKERPEESAASLLTPTTTDCSLTDAIAMDCEMVGISPQGNKSALGRITLVNASGNVIYDEYVRPLERVVDFRTEISGIRPHNLWKAKEFGAVQKKVAELIRGRILVGHALRNDLKALLLSHPKNDMRDTAEYQPFIKTEGRKRALRDLAAEILGIKIQQKEHCPIEDAQAAMLIYQRHKKGWERSIKEHMRFKEKRKKNHKRKKKPTNSDTAKSDGVFPS